jgi:uncharacterized PurR-regulated membrane protein YhhQ (DUF165 family)
LFRNHDWVEGPMKTSKAFASLSFYAGTIVLANWLTSRFGLVAVGFGLSATAGTYAAGLSLGARDMAQTFAGKAAVLAAVIAGAFLSAILANPQIALASGIAFLFSELLDFSIYVPLKKRKSTGWAIAGSNAAGAVLDTLLFLWIAGFPLTQSGVAGQLVGKAWMTFLALVVWRCADVVSRNRHRA